MLQIFKRFVFAYDTEDLYLFTIQVINFYVHIVSLYSFCPVGIPEGMVYSIRK